MFSDGLYSGKGRSGQPRCERVLEDSRIANYVFSYGTVKKVIKSSDIKNKNGGIDFEPFLKSIKGGYIL